MDELQILRELAAKASGDGADDVRRNARQQLEAAMAGERSPHPRTRAWLPRVAIGGAIVVGLGLLGASFLRTNKSGPAAQLPAGELEAIGLVVQRSDWPDPRLCPRDLGHQIECNGVEIVGWRWSEVRSDDVDTWQGEDPATKRSVSIKSAATYRLVGRFENRRFVLLQKPRRVEAWSDPAIAVRASDTTVCDPRPRVMRAFSDQEESELMINPFAIPDDSIVMWTSGGLLSVRVAQDPARALPAIRAVYHGPLCLVEGEVNSALGSDFRIDARPEDSLRRLMYPSGYVPSATMPAHQSTRLVPRVYDDGTFQAQMDRQYGKGRVRVQSFFRPALVDSARVDRFWKAFNYARAHIDWVRTYHSLSELRAGSKLIVRGRIESVALSPVSSPGLFQADLRVRVGATVAGVAPVGDLTTVRVMLMGATTAAQAKDTIRQLNRDLPAQDIVAFLAADGAVFRPLNDVGIWTHTGRARVDAPLAATAIGPIETPIADMPGVETLDQLVDAINYMGTFRTIPLPDNGG